MFVPFSRRTLGALALIVIASACTGVRLSAQPVTLAQVLDSVIARHPELRAADARVRAARGARTTAGLFANPMLSHQVEGAPWPGQTLAPGLTREAMTMATVPLEPLYQRGARVRSADATVRAAEADARGTRQQLLLLAARAYYRAAVAQVSADAASNLAAWFDSVATYNRTRVGQGVAAEADLIRAELERDRAVADAALDAAELARTRADLAAFAGDTVALRMGMTLTLDDAPLALPSDASNATLAVDARPDVSAARERFTASRADAALEQSRVVRELGATIGVKRTMGSNALIAGVSLPAPLFDRNQGEIARARAERDGAAFELAARERTARADLAGAAEAARILTDRAGGLTRRDASGTRPAMLARADEARAIALGAYREGAVSLLQVLDAARAWGEARVAFYRALYAQHDAVLTYLTARGDDIVAAVR